MIDFNSIVFLEVNFHEVLRSITIGLRKLKYLLINIKSDVISTQKSPSQDKFVVKVFHNAKAISIFTFGTFVVQVPLRLPKEHTISLHDHVYYRETFEEARKRYNVVQVFVHVFICLGLVLPAVICAVVASTLIFIVVTVTLYVLHNVSLKSRWSLRKGSATVHKGDLRFCWHVMAINRQLLNRDEIEVLDLQRGVSIRLSLY